MPYGDAEPMSKQLTIVVGLTVVGFMAFGLALSFYRNILFERTLSELEGQNRKIAADIDHGYQNLEYFQSDQFKDKYAKENLNKINPGEKIIIMTQPQHSTIPGAPDSALEKEQREAAYAEILRQMPVIDHWKLYFFHRDQLETFKQGL